MVKRTKVILDILIRTKAYKTIIVYIIVLFVTAVLILLTEPTVDDYADALWVTFSAASTIGFGDVLLTSIVSRILIVFIQVYAFIVLGIIIGVLVAFYNKVYDRTMEEEIDIHNIDEEDSFSLPELLYDALDDPKYQDMTISEIKMHFKERREEIKKAEEALLNAPSEPRLESKDF